MGGKMSTRPNALGICHVPKEREEINQPKTTIAFLLWTSGR